MTLNDLRYPVKRLIENMCEVRVGIVLLREANMMLLSRHIEITGSHTLI